MANVMFKRGLNSSLPSGNNIQDGAFYLTTDTHKLYVGQQLQTTDTPELVELNKSIITVANIDALPAASTMAVGQFYYIEGTGVTTADNTHNGNILAVVVQDGATKKWVQVNPDTDDGYDIIKSFTIGNGVVNSSNNTVTYTATLSRAHVDANGNETALSSFTPTFTINGSDLASITTDVEVDLTSTAVSNNSSTIKTSGSGANTNGTGVTMTGGTNVSITGGNASALTINANDSTYELTSPANTAGLNFVEKLNGVQTNSSSISFTAGTNLSVTGTIANNIEYSHATVTRTDTTATAESIANNAATFTVVDSVSTDTQGHVTGVATKNISVTDTTYSANSISANSSGDLSFSIIDNNNTSTNATASGALYHTLTIDGTAQTKYNQQDLGAFYSASKIDELLAGLNAMTYKGTIGSTGATVTALPTSAVKVGDTYMVKEAGTYASQVADTGDLFIASGVEINGIITSDLTWTLVPAGDDIDTQYSFTVSENATTHAATISAVPNPGNSNETVAVVIGGTDITASVNDSTITLNHNTISGLPSTAQGSNSNTTPTYGESFKIPQITVNDRGHVTALSETSITLPASNATTYSIGVDKTNSVVSIKLSDNNSGSSTAVVVGDGTSIAVDKNANNYLAISHGNLLTSGTAGTTYGISTSTSPVAGTGIIKVPNIKVNAQGHVTEIAEQSITLPSSNDTYFQLRPTTVGITTANNIDTATITLNMSDTVAANSNATTALIKIQSESLNISQPTSTTDTIQAEIEWGTF